MKIFKTITNIFEPKTDWAGVAEMIASQVSQANSRLIELRAERETLVLAVATGDAKASQRLSQINAEGAKIHQQLEDLESAAAQAQAKLGEQREAERLQKARERAVTVVAAAKELEANSAAVDRALSELAHLLRDRPGLINQFTHVLGRAVPRASDPLAIRMAIKNSGIDLSLLERTAVPRANCRPLSVSDRRFLSRLLDHASVVSMLLGEPSAGPVQVEDGPEEVEEMPAPEAA